MKYKPETAQKFYKCPYCGSKNIAWWEERVVERLYKIKRDGTPYKTQFLVDESNSDPNEGTLCMDCKETCDWTSEKFKDWIGEKE